MPYRLPDPGHLHDPADNFVEAKRASVDLDRVFRRHHLRGITLVPLRLLAPGGVDRGTRIGGQVGAAPLGTHVRSRGEVHLDGGVRRYHSADVAALARSLRNVP